MDILARGKYVITDASAGEGGILPDGAAYFSGGKVVEVGDYDSLKKKYPQATVKGNGQQLLMPGLIDGHSHGRGLSIFQRGGSYDFVENALIDWVFLIEIDPELNAMMSAVRHLRSGCTTIHHNNFGKAGQAAEMQKLAGKTIKGYKKIGIRCAYSPGVCNNDILILDDTHFFETLPPDLQEFCRPMVFYDKKAVVDEYMDLFDDLYGRYNDDNTRILFGPNLIEGITDDFHQRVKARADELGKIQIHIHTLQSPPNKAYALKKYGKSWVAHLDDLGLLDENYTFGHMVFADESDIELLASKRSSVTHHASCNLAIRNGIAPVYYLHRAGVNVALGIDDKAINDDEDIIMELRVIHRLHRVSGFDIANTPALDAFAILKMGTTNAARVCGFEGECGALKPGMKADAILVDLREMMEDPWMSPDINIAEVFIHRAKGVHVNTVIVGGEVVMEDRKFLNVDIDQLYEEVRKEVTKGISPQQRQYAETLQRIKPYCQEWYKGWENMDYRPFYVMNSRK
jgi:cytosine/adenosine deaminase-related metal-dependent hydrolase